MPSQQLYRRFGRPVGRSVPYTVVGSFTLPDYQVTVGGGNQSFDLSQYYVSQIPSGEEFSTFSNIGTALPAGWSLNVANQTLDYTDNVGAAGSAAGVILRVITVPTGTPTGDADWIARSTAPGVIRATDFSEYADRGALMSDLSAWNGPGSGVHYAYTTVPFDGGVDGNYADPVPNGTREKLGLSSAQSLTGGQSIYLRLYAEEGVTEAGPVFEFPFGTAASPITRNEYYFQFSVWFDDDYINHDFYGNGGSGNPKLAFLNHLNFTNGQIVMTTDNDGPFIGAYRVRTSADSLELVNPPFPDPRPAGVGSRNYYSFYDTDRGNTNLPTTQDAWESRFGFTRDNPNVTDPSYANVPYFQSQRWYTVTAYVNTTAQVAGASNPGIVKIWLAENGQAPELVVGGLYDVNLGSAAQDCPSVRLVARPEDATSAPPNANGSGAYFDQLILADQAPQHPGGFSLPFPGTEIPTGYLPPGFSEN